MHSAVLLDAGKHEPSGLNANICAHMNSESWRRTREYVHDIFHLRTGKIVEFYLVVWHHVCPFELHHIKTVLYFTRCFVRLV